MSASRRRTWVMATVGVAAAAVGVTVGWRRWSAGGAGLDGAESLWPLRFALPQGGELAMADWRGKPLILNFWATWCAPCIRELPALQRFRREHEPRGWRVLALAVDAPVPVLEFIARFKLDLPVALAGTDGLDVMRDLGNVQGGLPFSVLLDAEGRVRQRKLGESTYEDLLRWAAIAA